MTQRVEEMLSVVFLLSEKTITFIVLSRRNRNTFVGIDGTHTLRVRRVRDKPRLFVGNYIKRNVRREKKITRNDANCQVKTGRTTIEQIRFVKGTCRRLCLGNDPV